MFSLTEWPEEDDWSVQQEAKDIIAALLQQNPLDRLGVSGSIEVKGKLFSKVKLFFVISTKFKFSRQKLDTQLLENSTFPSIPNLK